MKRCEYWQNFSFILTYFLAYDRIVAVVPDKVSINIYRKKDFMLSTLPNENTENDKEKKSLMAVFAILLGRYCAQTPTSDNISLLNMIRGITHFTEQQEANQPAQMFLAAFDYYQKQKPQIDDLSTNYKLSEVIEQLQQTMQEYQKLENDRSGIGDKIITTLEYLRQVENACFQQRPFTNIPTITTIIQFQKLEEEYRNQNPQTGVLENGWSITDIRDKKYWLMQQWINNCIYREKASQDIKKPKSKNELF